MFKQPEFLKAAALLSLVAAFSTSAQADGIPGGPVMTYAPALFSWTGLYVGLNAGGGWNAGRNVDLFTNNTTPTNLGDATALSRGTIGKFADDGFGFFGGQIGYNHQAGRFVIGVEADIQATNQDDHINGLRFSNPKGAFPINGDARHEFDYFGTVRGRIGFAHNRLLVYATGGWAYGKVDYRLHAFEVGGSSMFETRLKSSHVESGYVVGGGLEYSLGPNLSLKFEYQYINLGDVDATAPVTLIANGARTGEIARLGSIDTDVHTIRLGFNYKFGGACCVVPIK
jgi:outer membrane immunogenic protein